MKTPKTGSTSIEVALRALCGPDDVITPIGAERELTGIRGPQNYDDKFFNHMRLEQVAAQVGPDVVRNYRKVAFVRNPWDRHVSLYHFLRFRREVTADFAGWLTTSKPKRLFNMLALDNELAIDFIGRYESIEDDFAQLCLELDCPPPPLPRLNADKRPANDDYRTYYDTALKDRIASACEREISAFGYVF